MSWANPKSGRETMTFTSTCKEILDQEGNIVDRVIVVAELTESDMLMLLNDEEWSEDEIRNAERALVRGREMKAVRLKEIARRRNGHLKTICAGRKNPPVREPEECAAGAIPTGGKP